MAPSTITEEYFQRHLAGDDSGAPSSSSTFRDPSKKSKIEINLIMQTVENQNQICHLTSKSSLPTILSSENNDSLIRSDKKQIKNVHNYPRLYIYINYHK